MDPRICCYVAILVCLHCIAADDELGRPLMGLTGSDLKRIGRHVRAAADKLGTPPVPPPQGLTGSNEKRIGRRVRATADELGQPPPTGLDAKGISRQKRGAAKEFGGLPLGRLVRAK